MNKLLLLSLFFIFGLYPNLQAQFCDTLYKFIQPYQFPEIEIGDLNNDGLPDFIFCGESNSSESPCRIMLNQGNQTFVGHYGLPDVGTLSSISLGDIDGDHDLDLFLSGYAIGAPFDASIYKNNGAGVFTYVQSLEGVLNGDSEFLDIENDGDLDLFYFGRGNATLKVTKLYKNDGLGHFTEIPSGLPQFMKGDMEIADIDLDGDIDILIAGNENTGNCGTRIFAINDGLGNFTTSPIPVPILDETILTLCHINDDPFIDLIANGANVSCRTYCYLGDSIGEFTPIGPNGLDSMAYGSIAVNDIDNDGDIDVFLTGMTDNGYYNDTLLFTSGVFLNNAGLFVKDTSFQVPNLFNSNTTLTDLDGNCSPDLIHIGGKKVYEPVQCILDYGQIYYNAMSWQGCDTPINDTTTVDESTDVVIRILENPIKNILEIEVKQDVSCIKIIDLNGRILKERYTNKIHQDEPIITFDITELNASFYFVQAESRTHKIQRLQIMKSN